MPNGTPGDHPLTDVLLYRRPTFNPEVDGLIVELEPLGVWKGELIGFLMLGLHDDVQRLRSAGDDQRVDTLLHNFAGVLRDERKRLQRRDA